MATVVEATPVEAACTSDVVADTCEDVVVGVTTASRDVVVTEAVDSVTVVVTEAETPLVRWPCCCSTGLGMMTLTC